MRKARRAGESPVLEEKFDGLCTPAGRGFLQVTRKLANTKPEERRFWSPTGLTGLIDAALGLEKPSNFSEGEDAMTAKPPAPNVPRKRLVIFGLILGVISLSMYVSIIIKTAMMGP